MFNWGYRASAMIEQQHCVIFSNNLYFLIPVIPPSSIGSQPKRVFEISMEASLPSKRLSLR